MKAAQRLIPRQSSRGRLIELNSSHLVQDDHPDTVVAEVLRGPVPLGLHLEAPGSALRSRNGIPKSLDSNEERT
jgi:hypothetical protein